jgi:hypothetical protein
MRFYGTFSRKEAKAFTFDSLINPSKDTEQNGQAKRKQIRTHPTTLPPPHTHTHTQVIYP